MAKKSAAKTQRPDGRRAHPTEVVPIASLKPHPRNYKRHPAEQVEHLCASLRQYGQFRNVVVARESTILAGHGVVQAMAKLGWAEVTVVRLDLDPMSVKALKLVALDNELPKFAETDDRMLTELLREVSLGGVEELLGTGYDRQSLTLLEMVTRPPGEVRDFDAAGEWGAAGMPEFDAGADLNRLVIQFRSEAERKAFVEKFGIEVLTKKSAGSHVSANDKTWSAWWPPRQREDRKAVRWRAGKGGKDPK